MTKRSTLDSIVTWTWAEQISTYRFWGLLIFYVFSTIASTILTTFFMLFLREGVGLQTADGAMILGAISIAGLFGFYLAWLSIRWNTKNILIVFGVLQLVGCFLITTPSLASIAFLRFAGAIFIGLGAGGVLLAIPSIVAGGRGGEKAFVLSFGVVTLFSRIGQMYAPMLMGQFMDNFGMNILRTVVPLSIFLGLLALLPVKPSFFKEPPSQGSLTLPPTYRSPITVALLSLIPFYSFYWQYRAHGEVSTIAPSRNILSPQAAWLTALWVPLISPVIFTSLIDALNLRAAEMGKNQVHQPWVIFLWAFFFQPVAIALLQSDLNKAMLELTSTPTETSN